MIHTIYQTGALCMFIYCKMPANLMRTMYCDELVPGSGSIISTVCTESLTSSGLFPGHQTPQGGGRSRLHVSGVFPDEGVSASTGRQHLTEPQRDRRYVSGTFFLSPSFLFKSQRLFVWDTF